MRKRLGAIAVAMTGSPSAGASNAAAATEVGNSCTATTGIANTSAIQLTRTSASPFPLTVPAAGVVTRWKVNVTPEFPGLLAEQLKVFRASGAQFVVAAESEHQQVTGGLNSFATRIPVQAGDRFGLGASTPSGALQCETGNPGDIVGLAVGNVPLGAVFPTVLEEPGHLVAVSAVVEPDADADGFGDETQDQCPQVATVQTACPPVVVDAAQAIKKKGSVTVLVTVTSQAPVTVSGKVNLGKGRKANLKGGTQTVVPGTLARFVLPFPKKLKAALKALPRKRSLKLNLTAKATDLIGRVTSDALKVNLKGQAAPPKKR